MLAIGIDFGTTNSSVGVWKNGGVKIISNADGYKTTPSCVAFTETGRLIGDDAKNQAASNPENTVFDAKRLIGQQFNDVQFQYEIGESPLDVINYNNKPKIRINLRSKGKETCIEDITSIILRKMRHIAEDYLDKKVNDAVITVPAYFNNSQRHAMKIAGTLAGLNVLKLINAPTAAALAYGFDKRPRRERIVLIFDVGGGTTDVSIVKIKDGLSFVVKSTAGDIYLGGEDIDTILVNYFCAEFKNKFDKNLKLYPQALRRLRTEAVRAKHELSTNSRATIFINSLVEGVNYKIDYYTEITREEFNCLCADLFERALATIKNAMADAKISIESIDDVVLVGGSTRIPKIQSMVQDYFHGKQLTLRNKSDDVGAYGAAIQAALLMKNSKIPSILRGMHVTDVIPFSVNISLDSEGHMTRLFKRNTNIPCKCVRELTTTINKQSTINYMIHEGENTVVKYNNIVGRFIINGIPQASAGKSRILLTFVIDDNGVLKMTAERKIHDRRIRFVSMNIRKSRENFDTEQTQIIVSRVGKLVGEKKKKQVCEKTKINVSHVGKLVDEKKEIKSLGQIKINVSDDGKLWNDKKEIQGFELRRAEKNQILNIFENAIEWINGQRVIGKNVYHEKLKEVREMCISVMRRKNDEDNKARVHSSLKRKRDNTSPFSDGRSRKKKKYYY